jgi:diacylglycerol kinase family enzyme
VQFPLSDKPPVAIRRVCALVNPASGSVGPATTEDLAAFLSERGLDHRVAQLTPETTEEAVRRAVDAGPDLIVVLGGDGTARLVAEACGPDGPLVAPLPGGTMNKLGRALYDSLPWRDALTRALEAGAPRWIPGGLVGGRAFYCGAVLGSPALLARAREAIRDHELGRAWRQTVVATRRAMRNRIAFDLDRAGSGQGVAISFICPTVSSDPDGPEGALKAAVLEPPQSDAGATAGLRMLLSNLLFDWREDPDVAKPCLSGRAWARTSMPVMLDGEYFRLGREVEIRYRPRSFRALALL